MISREVRIFGTYEDMFADWTRYPRNEWDETVVRGKFIGIINRHTNVFVYWYNEEDFDVKQAISGLEITSLTVHVTVSRAVAEWALARVRRGV